ncbi:hypothetical protein FA13DRAFT_1886772 [Coprinellus micaceus]|uniref:Uncharacterized protein n=1 Tax=Coprinellus micaceus TaxID=71717 RepID=A0A4Y7RRJ5_COPMI|nr:hypothetical protein FA13DRAFT_1886772 [Coprinellus micaceus]
MREWVSGMFTGSYLAGVSKLIFEDSRLYYVVALSTNTLTTIMILANSISIPLRSAFFVLNVTLVNIMACQAHRNMKLPMFQHPNFTTSELSPPPTAAPRDGFSSCRLPVRFKTNKHGRHRETQFPGSG